MSYIDIDLAAVAKQASMRGLGNMGDDYTDEEWSFMRSIEEYKRKYKRPFPTSREVLAVAKSIGYRVLTQAVPDKPANHKAILRKGRRFQK